MNPQELASIDIHELLPQQEPFVLIDQLCHYDEQQTITRFTVRPDHLMTEGDHLMTCALAENMAQTCAARLGYYNKYILREGIQIGFIGDIKNMAILDTAHVGDTLLTTVNVTMQLMDVTLVHATITCGERTIATADLKIALLPAAPQEAE